MHGNVPTSRYMIQFESCECGSSPTIFCNRVHSYQCLSHSVRPTLRLHPCRGALLTDLARVRNFGDKSGEKSIAIHLYSHVQVWKSFIYLLQISDIFLAMRLTKPILIFKDPNQVSQPVRGRLLFQSLMGPQLLFFADSSCTPLLCDDKCATPFLFLLAPPLYQHFVSFLPGFPVLLSASQL